MREPYTYRIGWSKTGMNYYGVRYAKDCRPSELFVTYFTSSAYVADYIKEHGQPDIIEIRKRFRDDQVSVAREYEHRVLKRLVGNPKWLNKTHNKGYPIISGDSHPSKRPEVRANISKGTKLATPRGDNHPRRKDPSRWDNANTPEVNLRRREKVMTSEASFKAGEDHLEASCIHCREIHTLGHLFRWHGDNCDQNPKKVLVDQTCPHCGFTGQRNMNQYHFDNCKHNPENKNLERFHSLSESNNQRVRDGTHNFAGENSSNYIRLSCVGCRKETNVPSLRFHKVCVTGDPSDIVTYKKQEAVTCPHCNKTGAPAIMKRWHFDNCKHKTS